MYEKIILKKGLALCTILLFISMSAISTAEEVKTEENAIDSDSPEIINFEPECQVFFTGPEGKNNWFIGDVTIYFLYYPERVAAIYYKIGTGNWKTYNWEPFYFTTEGEFAFEYKWEDHDGNETYPPTGEIVKLDKTHPTITLDSKVGLFNKNKLTITATVDDKESLIDRVEFFFDGVSVLVDEDKPYEYVYLEAEEGHTVTATVHDKAGLNTTADITTEPLSFPHLYLNNILQRLYSINPWLIYLIKTILKI
jgi:hypothetical protein